MVYKSQGIKLFFSLFNGLFHLPFFVIRMAIDGTPVDTQFLGSRAHRLSAHDQLQGGQRVWLRLVTHFFTVLYGSRLRADFPLVHARSMIFALAILLYATRFCLKMFILTPSRTLPALVVIRKMRS